MIPDFPQIIKIRLAPSKLFFVASVAVSVWLNQPKGQGLCKVRTQQKKMGPILVSYYEESLNSKLLWFLSVRPNLDIFHAITLYQQYQYRK